MISQPIRLHVQSKYQPDTELTTSQTSQGGEVPHSKRGRTSPCRGRAAGRFSQRPGECGRQRPLPCVCFSCARYSAGPWQRGQNPDVAGPWRRPNCARCENRHLEIEEISLWTCTAERASPSGLRSRSVGVQQAPCLVNG